ncbi:hypothetical protein [Komagataeibacter xylinus]|uniref:hypothetical protein n=1 Tax=Komagataeibacter xylinus TaxID=28448 RepID=UPI001F5E524C|nr:hypothetical protein [Komagataeibacter xylinus]
MRIPSFSITRHVRLSHMLLVCSVLAPLPVWADEDPESLDIMERQMEQLQQQQMALQKSLQAMRQQIIQHRAQMGGTAAHGGHPLEVTGSGGHVRGGWTPTEGHTATPSQTAGIDPMARPRIGGHSDPVSELGDQPTYESVVAHREEDLISHMANNNIGPHNRETVGALSAGALGSKVFHLGSVSTRKSHRRVVHRVRL